MQISEDKKATVGVHHLKSHPEYYSLVKEGIKPWELRKNDRDFREGDKIVLEEWDPKKAEGRRLADGYTGRSIDGVITHVVGAGSAALVGLCEGYVVLSVCWA
jgi:hypothetical protein